MDKKTEKAKFDADYSPNNPQNVQAAKDHDLRFDKRRQRYVDSDGFAVRDKFGQPL
ncbi:MAG: hypothetical protein ABA06_03575 [Parcubacteria bacterium C7867-001]|nr:MAG: hypothetical protein ABA06_03575 [Parcubacteria bacterium C7867-001]